MEANITIGRGKAVQLDPVAKLMPLKTTADDVGPNDSDSNASIGTSVCFCVGDRVCSSEDLSTAVAVDDGSRAAAVAVGGGEPKQRRHQKPPRDTTPAEPQSRCAHDPHSEARLLRSQKVSNVGWLFGNWGALPKQEGKRDKIEEVHKKQPAMIIGLAECNARTEAQLRMPGWLAPRSCGEPRDSASGKLTST